MKNITNKMLKSTLLVTLFLVGCYSCLEVGGRVGTHGYQVVFTDQLKTNIDNEIMVYFYHLGGYQYPHDYQYVFRGRMIINKPLEFNRIQLYHCLSTDSSLDDLIAGKTNSFEGSLFKGTFYDGIILSDKVTFYFINAVFENQLIDETRTTTFAQYFIFGRSTQNLNIWNVAHIMEGKPNFNHVVKVEYQIKGNSTEITDGDIIILPDVKNDAESKLKVGQNYTGFRWTSPFEIITFSNVELYDDPKFKQGLFLEKSCSD